MADSTPYAEGPEELALLMDDESPLLRHGRMSHGRMGESWTGESWWVMDSYVWSWHTW